MDRSKLKLDLKLLFGDLQDELRASLNVSRMHVKHPTLKGDCGEIRWVETLQNYLPLRYQAERACVVDSNGQVSDQLDVVVFDRHFCPFLLNHHGVRFVPREAVYAVFEVKQKLDSKSYVYAQEKSESVRILECTSGPIWNMGMKMVGREVFPPLSGILALDGQRGDLRTFLESQPRSTQFPLDLGCCVNWGAWDYCEEEGERQLECAENEGALVFFIIRLVHRLQALGTVPSIELSKYEASFRNEH